MKKKYLFFIFIFFSFSTCQVYDQILKKVKLCRENVPLGMITGRIHDPQISSSSVYPKEWDPFCAEKYARPYIPDGRSWCAKYQSGSEWIQVDLGLPSKVTGIMTQGRCHGDEWVTSFSISYSLDGREWEYVRDDMHDYHIFEGNKDSCHVKHSHVEEALLARFIRVHIISWNKHPSMRVEFVGCQVCDHHLVFPPYTKMTASSFKRSRESSTCQPHHAYLLSNKAWCAKKSNAKQWLQIDIGPPTLITGIITRGRGEAGKQHWVKRFTLSYSNDTSNWLFYRSASEPHVNHIFTANRNKDHEVINFLTPPFPARFIRIHPVEWHRYIALRVGLIGCPFEGQCTDGFMRINENTQCVENLAFNKSSWINNKNMHRKRHARHHWTRAVPLSPATPVLVVQENEFRENSPKGAKMPSCIILDNFSVERPIWLIDLQRKTVVSGIVIKTPVSVATNRMEEETLRDYMHGLDKLVIYLDDHESKDQITKPEVVCGVVTASSGSLFKPRIHIPCLKSMKARYVFVEAWGIEKRQGRLFSAAICDVEIYE